MTDFLIKSFQEELKKKDKPKVLASSFKDFENVENISVTERGGLFKKSAVLVLAGGSGSRLRFEQPKGCFPISNVMEKSLFELLASKVCAASKFVNHPLEMAVMTSPQNRRETEQFFKDNNFFGLLESQVHFFSQDLWPLLSLTGEIFMGGSSPAFGPNGNGGAFKALFESPIFTRWKENGIEIVNVIPIDNPLANPFDAKLFSYHVSHENEVTIKATKRKSPKEKVGVIVDGPKVIEYGDVTLLDEENALAFIGLFCVSLSFIERSKDVVLPLHKAKKTAKVLGENGTFFLPKEPNVWKFELFLFDIFEEAKKIGVVCFPREECFAPLKNFEGDDSILTVKAALLASDKRMFQEITKVTIPDKRVFELASDFYFPTPELLKKWHGQSLPKTPYIEAK